MSTADQAAAHIWDSTTAQSCRGNPPEPYNASPMIIGRKPQENEYIHVFLRDTIALTKKLNGYIELFLPTKLYQEKLSS